MIREFAEEDLDELVDVWYRASQVGHPFLDEEFFAREREEMVATWIPAADVTVAEVDGRVVGFLALLGDEVGALFVDPELHGAGVGRALMDDARASHPQLELDVFERNTVGRAFYTAYGFRPIGRKVHAQTGQVELRLRLDADR